MIQPFQYRASAAPPYTAFSAAVMILFCGGCLPKLSPDDLSQLRPQRPPELEKLNMLLGEWETTGEIRMAVLDAPIHTKGKNRATWSLDGRVVLDQAELDMGPLGPMTGMSLWTWDPQSKKYHMHWFDSFGETSFATVSYHAGSKTWRMKARGQKYGHSTAGHGTLRAIDADTLEWTWNETDSLGWINFAEMKGISRRVKGAS